MKEIHNHLIPQPICPYCASNADFSKRLKAFYCNECGTAFAVPKEYYDELDQAHKVLTDYRNTIMETMKWRH
jgi:predicted amidophosphoribosyltransferase